MQFLRTPSRSHFFTRNLVERVVIYVLLSDLLVKIIYELILGQWAFRTTTQKQYLFFALMALDYLITANRLTALRVRCSYLVVFAAVLSIATLQGILVGLSNGNQMFKIFNDSVPLLVLALNVLRMQSANEPPLDLHFLLKATSIFAIGICAVGNLTILLGLPGNPSLGALPGGIYFPLLFAFLITGRHIAPGYVLTGIIVLGLSITNLNRTTLAFLFICVIIFTVVHSLRRPAAAVAAVAGVFALLTSAWLLLPSDSKTYNRIATLTSINLEERTGSIGERAAEFDSIRQKLSFVGTEAEWLGLGHGGVYEVRFTHYFNTDYGHAHFAWALFELRYGLTGYLYLSFLVGALLYQIARHWSINCTAGVFIALICIQSLLYLTTYATFVILLAGIQFSRSQLVSKRGMPPMSRARLSAGAPESSIGRVPV